MNRLPGHPKDLIPLDLPLFREPRFLVTIDAEEEFDWSGEFSRQNLGTTHVPAIAKFQHLCDSHGTSPLYLVDFPIASDAGAIDLIGQYIETKRAEIGLQLHPWVSPPFEEEVNRTNSFACNLPPELEREKIRNLDAQVRKAFKTAPLAYRAGRYGAGPNSMACLRELGVRFDTSVRSLFDYSHEGGPDYSHCDLRPYWIYPGELAELPLTTIFAGALRKGGRRLFQKSLSKIFPRSLMARTGLLERVALTPEGIPQARAIEAIDIALDMGLPLLNFSFHSPSLAVGHTPYVRTEQELEAFYSWWDAVFAHLQAKGVKPTTVSEISAATFGNADTVS